MICGTQQIFPESDMDRQLKIDIFPTLHISLTSLQFLQLASHTTDRLIPVVLLEYLDLKEVLVSPC